MPQSQKRIGDREKAKQLRDAEARTALREYAQRAEAEDKKTARLRALRLAREAEVAQRDKHAPPAKAPKPARKIAGPKR